jgi:hypothetical protein
LGCSFFYPIVDQCITNPLVPISNVRLVNVSMHEGVFLPGVILCNSTNPCSGFYFENVVNHGPFIVQDSYQCENIIGTAVNCKPAPACFTNKSTVDPANLNDAVESEQEIGVVARPHAHRRPTKHRIM